MDLWLVMLLYLGGLGLIVAEALMPGVVMGLLGTAALVTSVVFGFQHHWMIGAAQIGVAVVVGPAAFLMGIRRMTLKSSLEGGTSFAQDYSEYLGREGEAHTELRPSGVVVIEDRKVDVVTGGESVAKGTRVRVVKVEGNRIVVKAI